MNLNKHNKIFDFEEGQDHRTVNTNVIVKPDEKLFQKSRILFHFFHFFILIDNRSLICKIKLLAVSNNPGNLSLNKLFAFLTL